MNLVTRSSPPCRLKLKMKNAAATVTKRKITLTAGFVIIGTKPRVAV